MLLQLSHFPPFIPLCPAHLLPPASSLPWFISLGRTCTVFGVYSSYTILNLPCLFSTYHLCYLFPVPFPSFPLPLPTDNPPCDLHFCDSVPVLLACIFFICLFVLGSVVDSCEFVVIFLCLVLMVFFFLDKSL